MPGEAAHTRKQLATDPSNWGTVCAGTEYLSVGESVSHRGVSASHVLRTVRYITY